MTETTEGLALALWAELDTEVNPAGIIAHSQAVPIIMGWLMENSVEIAIAVQHDKLRNGVEKGKGGLRRFDADATEPPKSP